MKNTYSIIIPIFNELAHLQKLINELKPYYKKGHEIIIIDDGSNDGSYEFLLQNKTIKLYRFNTNKGKGNAIKKGIIESNNEKIILYDADFELHPKDITKLMILNREKGIESVFGNRFNTSNSNLFWDLGNILITKFFNLVNGSNLDDALCCAKSFYKSDITLEEIRSKKFDIDVEILSQLICKGNNFRTVDIDYTRRGKTDGKKLKTFDGFYIVFKICTQFKKFYN